jgi:hypothetical protein
MKQYSTPNTLILHAYNELDSFSAAQIQTEMENNEALQDEFDAIENVMHHLDADIKKPHASSIDIILKYSRNSNKEKQEDLVTY